jgi:predicted DNA-binding WGR domain protein
MKGLKRAIVDDEDGDNDAAATSAAPKKPSLAIAVDDPQLAAHWHVLDHPKEGVLDALLNQTNIGQNNNKFFVLQVVAKDNDAKKFKLLTRWGRVGARGQTKQEDFSNAEVRHRITAHAPTVLIVLSAPGCARWVQEEVQGQDGKHLGHCL